MERRNIFKWEIVGNNFFWLLRGSVVDRGEAIHLEKGFAGTCTYTTPLIIG